MPTCADCLHFRTVTDQGTSECAYGPPTPIVIGVQTQKLMISGQDGNIHNLTVRACRPPVDKTTPACTGPAFAPRPTEEIGAPESTR